MKQSELMNILDDVATGKVTKEEALLAIKEEPFKDMGFAKIDTHRGIRQGVPEVLYGAGKTKEQIKEIVKYLQKIFIVLTKRPSCAILCFVNYGVTTEQKSREQGSF